MTIQEIIDRQMSAFNNKDIVKMMSLYTDDTKIYTFSDHELVINGKKECEEMFVKLFEQSPDLNADFIKTIYFTNKAIVHEYVYGRNGIKEKKNKSLFLKYKTKK